MMKVTASIFLAGLLAVVCVPLVSAAPSISGEDTTFGRGEQTRDIEETIWFQGYLADDATGEPIDASYDVIARIYSDPVAGVSLWGPETHSSVPITAGWFNIELGSVVGSLPAFDAPPYYLQLQINGETLSPRLKMASVPSAFQSLNADDGLQLPYSGSWDSSGDAFSITNDGPNICGYFRINNPGSSATALYGRHNGTGAAVMGWADGSGPAIRGVANGTGYAGKFDGPVTISDSLHVGGWLIANDNALVGDTLMVGNGFWFAKDPVPGYVLRCADEWGTAEWGPPNVMDAKSVYSYDGIVGTGYYNQTGAQVSVNVPGPGYICVDSDVWFVFNHTSGTADKLYLAHSTDPNALPASPSEWMFWEVPASLGTELDLDRALHVHNTFEVTEYGLFTYYLVAHMTNGIDGDDHFAHTRMRAIYYPYPIAFKQGAEGAPSQATGDRVGR